ncbi:hypothetical protein F4801DRAFT_597898 [Xylaria longipes]|nr:hypothetical protein F4801DRAFT_597898 [Xylaria longipes]
MPQRTHGLKVSDFSEPDDDAKSFPVDVKVATDIKQQPVRRSLRILGLPPPTIEVPEIKRRKSARLYACEIAEQNLTPATQKPTPVSHEDDDCIIVGTRQIEQLPKEPPFFSVIPTPASPLLPPFSTFDQFYFLTPPHRAPQHRPLIPGPPLTSMVAASQRIQGPQQANQQIHHLSGRNLQLPSFAELVESTTIRQNPPSRTSQ